jgi:hypothetical protein
MFVTQKDKEKAKKQLLASGLVSSRFKSVVREALASSNSQQQQQQQQHARATEKTAAQVSIRQKSTPISANASRNSVYRRQ